VRYVDLTAAGREAVDLYARARAKLAAIDRWLEKNPMLDETGQPAPAMALYSTLLNTSARLLAQVLAVLEAMDRADGRYDKLSRHIEATYGQKARALEPPVELKTGFEADYVLVVEDEEAAK
jgi:hypothetical protein